MESNPPTHPVTVLLAGPDMHTTVMRLMYPAFQDTARFQLISVTADWEGVQKDVARYKPEALVLDATIAPDLDALRAYLETLVGRIALLVIPPAWEARRGLLEGIQTSVRGVFVGPPNWDEIARRTYSAAITRRGLDAAASPVGAAVHKAAAVAPVAGQVVIGTRTIALLSFAGGVGKSTIAETLAVELARSHVRTLLCSFNSPPAAFGHLGLCVTPSAAEWFARPGAESFRAALQHPRGFDDLDVLVAPNEPQAYAEAASRRPEDPASILNLVFSAYAQHYGVILLDLPPFADSMWPVQALLAANVAVLVSRPTVHDQMAAIRAYELLTRHYVAEVRVPPEAIFAVLNFVSPKDNLSERDFHGAIVHEIGRYPPILASFPYVAGLPSAQNRADSPALAPECTAFAEVGRALAGKLVGSAVQAPANGGGRARKFGFKLKVSR